MKVSDVIRKLQELQAEHGDLTVVSTTYEQEYEDVEEYRTDDIQVVYDDSPRVHSRWLGDESGLPEGPYVLIGPDWS